MKGGLTRVSDMSTAELENAVVRLEWSLSDGNVVVTARDQDRFVIKLNRAISILQQGQQAERFGYQFNLLLRMLAEWLRDREGIANAFLTDRDGALAFVVVRESRQYDDDFEDAISDLDFRLANDPDLDLVTLDVIALPAASESALSSFLDPGFTFEYVGNGNRV
jgi:hypothetical protein